MAVKDGSFMLQAASILIVRISCATSLKLEIVLVKMGKAVKKRSHIRHDGITGNPELYEETSDESFSAVQDSVIQSIFDQVCNLIVISISLYGYKVYLRCK